jgi:hypothetical protein
VTGFDLGVPYYLHAEDVGILFKHTGKTNLNDETHFEAMELAA